MNILNLLGLFLFTTLFRGAIRFYFPKSIDYDTYFHLFLIDFIRKNGTKNLSIENRFIKKAGLNYPWILHKTISLFPQKLEIFLEKYFNSFIDAIYTVTLYIATFYVTNSNTTALIVSTMYIFTPMMFSSMSLGPRIKSFSPRIFGEVLGGLVFVFEFLYLETENYYFFCIAIFLASLAYLSSKFTVQALYLINIFIILFTLHYEIIFILFFGFLLSMLYSRGAYLSILKEQFYHLKWYFINNLKGIMFISSRNNLKILFQAIITLDIKTLARQIILDNTILIVLFRFPLAYFALYLSVDSLASETQISNIDIIIYSGFIVFTLTSLKWFLFIGEAERYLNYIVFFLLLKCVLTFEEENLYLILYIGYGILFYIAEFFFVKTMSSKETKKNDTLIDWLNAQKEVIRIATVPFGLGGWRIVKETSHNWLLNTIWLDQEEKTTFSTYMSKHSEIDLDKFDEVYDKYSLNYIILDLQKTKKILKNIPKSFKTLTISDNIVALYK